MATEKPKFDRNSVTFYADVLEALEKGEITDKEYTELLFPIPQSEEIKSSATTTIEEKPEVEEEKEEKEEEAAKEKTKAKAA